MKQLSIYIGSGVNDGKKGWAFCILGDHVSVRKGVTYHCGDLDLFCISQACSFLKRKYPEENLHINIYTTYKGDVSVYFPDAFKFTKNSYLQTNMDILALETAKA